MTPQPTAPAPKRNGCLIALMVVGGLAALVCIGSSVAMFVAARSDTGKKIFSAIDQGVKLAEAGVNAPGAAEVREAGCPEAFVLDMQDAMKIADTFFDGGLTKDEDSDYMMVSCGAKAGSNVELPSCEAIAAVYAKAVPSERPFVVEVKRANRTKPECHQQFEGDGTFVKDMKK